MFTQSASCEIASARASISDVPDASAISSRVSELEHELNGLSKAMADRFEELALIHDLTERLNLEDDCETICDGLLLQLGTCIGAETIAIELFGDHETGIRSQLFHVGASIEVKEIEAIDGICDSDSTVAVNNDWVSPSGWARRAVVVRIEHQQRAMGKMVAIRHLGHEEFGTIEADLMKSTSMMLGMHLANQRQYLEMQQMFEGTIQSLVSALDAKDAYTSGHSTRVAELTVELASRLGYDADQLANIRMAGILHDIGKIGVDDSVLRKPGKLTDEEFEQIKTHPVLGYEILKGIRRFRDILPAVRHHHESWDGSGYPDGLKGEDIPRDAQIMAVADAFDAMTSDRPYRPGMSLERVTAIFLNGRGQQWAADVVDTLLSATEILDEYAEKEGPA